MAPIIFYPTPTPMSNPETPNERSNRLAALLKPDEAPHVNPNMSTCPKCDGSGTNHHELAQRGGWIHGGDIHECYQCEGLGYVRATT